MTGRACVRPELITVSDLRMQVATHIHVKGAREHNLKNLEVRIPRLAGVPLVAEDLQSGAVKGFKKSLKLGFQGAMVRRIAISARD